MCGGSGQFGPLIATPSVTPILSPPSMLQPVVGAGYMNGFGMLRPTSCSSACSTPPIAGLMAAPNSWVTALVAAESPADCFSRDEKGLVVMGCAVASGAACAATAPATNSPAVMVATAVIRRK